MLQLTPKINETVIIDDDIKIAVISDTQGQIRLGIEAPDDIETWREEIYEKIQEKSNR